MTDDLVSRLRAQMLFPEDDVIREVCTCMPWKLSEVRHHAHLLHVNLREFDGMALVTRRAAAFSTFPLRMTNGSDSEVTIGAACKGRSPSHQLNTYEKVRGTVYFGMQETGSLQDWHERQSSRRPHARRSLEGSRACPGMVIWFIVIGIWLCFFPWCFPLF